MMVDQATDPLGRIFGIPQEGETPMVDQTIDQLSEIFEANARAMSTLILTLTMLPDGELNSIERGIVDAMVIIAYAVGDACACLHGMARAL